MQRVPTKPVLDSLRELKGFVFDLDGTIWEGPRLLPGAAALVAGLRAAGLGVMFASNCSRYGAGVLRDRLAGLGIGATAEQVVSAFDLVGAEIRRRLGPLPVLAVGTEELVAVLRASGHSHVPFENWEQASAVVVGVDPDFNYDRLRGGSARWRRGRPFLRSTWMPGSRSARACSIRDVDRSPKRSPLREAAGPSRSASPKERSFRSRSKG